MAEQVDYLFIDKNTLYNSEDRETYRPYGNTQANIPSSEEDEQTVI